VKPRLYEYKGRRVRARNKEQANRLLGNPLGYKDLMIGAGTAGPMMFGWTARPTSMPRRMR
jgi:hypothetical protein